MNMKLAVLIFVSFAVQGTLQSPSEERLLHEILSKREYMYNHLARPIAKEADSMEVKFGISLQQILDLHETDQQLKTLLWLNYEWKDYKLAWNTSEYDGLQSIRLPTSLIWTPDILLYNTLSESFDNLVHHTDVVVYNDGTCSWVPGGVFSSTCPVNPTWYPFDEQKCSLKFGSWTYDGLKLNITSRSRTIDISTYSPNQEWELLDAPATRSVLQYDCCPEPYIDITFMMHIRRRSYHAKLVLLPPALIAFITWFSFILPVSCGERLTLGIIQLITMGWVWATTTQHIVFSFTLADTFCSTMFFGSFISFLWTIVVIKIYHCSCQMPAWLENLSGIIERCLFCNDAGEKYRNLGAGARASFDGDAAKIQPDKENDGRDDWIALSRVMDRLLALLYLVFYILSCGIILGLGQGNQLK